MITDLLYISKELLSYLDSDNNLSIKEEKYILSVIHKMIIISIIELGRMNNSKIKTTLEVKRVSEERRDELYKKLTKKDEDIYKELAK